MSINHNKIAAELSLNPDQISAVQSLVSQGGTIPFIARYRKEKTGNLDEVKISEIINRLEALEKLEQRRKTILATLNEKGITDAELISSIKNTENPTTLEDLYLPYRPKRKTKAAIARQKGLEPLAEILWIQQDHVDPDKEAEKFVNDEVPDQDTALAGARDILAEKISEDAEIRARLRHLFATKSLVKSRVMKGREVDGHTYSDYFDHQESASKAGTHRILAMFRGEREKILHLSIRPDNSAALEIIQRQVLSGNNKSSLQVDAAASDSWKRLLAPSLENELRKNLKEKADLEAIQVFATNLESLLMSPPLGSKPVMAVDPGFRTGCKVVVLDENGNLAAHALIHPFDKPNKAGYAISNLLDRFQISAIAIGNGTAGRETETFFRALDLKIPVLLVNESGASVYSASDIAREEFPDHDITVRGAVSIGRRLMDPLAELVKIDPKAIGVGQYQHDVDQSLLRKRLDNVVSSCVNRVGVSLNTASAALLSYVAGLGPSLAKAVVQYRTENGPFKDRKSLTKVPRLGARTFEQAAGFFRVEESSNPLDASAVHPERYSLVNKMATDIQSTIKELVNNPDLRARINIHDYISREVGLHTLQDIMSELDKPGRDPREKFIPFSFADVHAIEDLEPGMIIPGIVTNVTNFGCFVDVGVHQDGLVHISQMADRFIRNPHDIASPGQKVQVQVIDVDIRRNRIALSMKKTQSGV
ncbi:Tex family protein [Desulfonatronovibrio magnus]|uniref:Tex family protein n=1 Tax=Desulfonatronovibrio magnus TaxID=698827 RepID=UPI0005EB68C2|nr:Tex family protein [Desulfonatronovibrio magnus]